MKLRLFIISIMAFINAYVGILFFKTNYPGTGIGLLVLSVGMFLNLIAVLSNNWQMPVFLKHIKEKKWIESNPNYNILNKKTKFKCLCDIYRYPYIYRNNFYIYSIGDYLIKIGRIIFFIAVTSYLILWR